MEKEGVSEFSHQEAGAGKIGKNITYFNTNYPFRVLSFCECLVFGVWCLVFGVCLCVCVCACARVCMYTCVFCLFTPFLSVLFVFHRKNLVLLNLINRYIISTSEWFLKNKTLWKVNVSKSVNYSFSLIQVVAVSTYQVMFKYTYMGVSVYWILSVLRFFVCVCLTSNQNTSKKTLYVSDLGKLDVSSHS